MPARHQADRGAGLLALLDQPQLLASDTFAAAETLPPPGSPALRNALAPVRLAISAPQGFFTHLRSGLATIGDFAAAASRRSPISSPARSLAASSPSPPRLPRRAGQLVPLAVPAATRTRDFPEVPIAAETIATVAEIAQPRAIVATG